MNLKTYLSKKRGRAVKLAKVLSVTPVTVHGWVNERVPAERCPAIERATAGQVKCEDLRPDVDWAVLRCTCALDLETTHDSRGPREHELQEVA